MRHALVTRRSFDIVGDWSTELLPTLREEVLTEEPPPDEVSP